jgi:ABC-type phosphate/phosphonate transport system permease subunit
VFLEQKSSLLPADMKQQNAKVNETTNATITTSTNILLAAIIPSIFIAILLAAAILAVGWVMYQVTRLCLYCFVLYGKLNYYYTFFI